MPRTTLLLVVLAATTVGVLSLLFFWRPSQSSDRSSVGNPADLAFRVDPNRTTLDHPVYVSQTYGFEYAPTGAYSHTVVEPTGTQVFGVSIVPNSGVGGLTIQVYSTGTLRNGTNLAAFRSWRTANGYQGSDDPIVPVTVGSFRLLKATQANGIDSFGDYYYLLRETYVYVFPFDKGTPTERVAAALTPLTLTGNDYLLPTEYDSTMALDDLGEKHLVGSAADKLIAEVSAVESWTHGTTDMLGDPSCGTGPKHDALVAFNAGERRSLMLNDGFLITATPNTFRWTAADLQAFLADSEGDAIACGVGTTVPEVLQGDWVLWWNRCVGGVTPDPSLPDYPRTVRCLQAQEVVETHFGL